ncbi:MAG: hypothetical protein K1X74_11925 [Pirellulales bacterium]|nr:hypothetical protein [Pirellulales bacterium]
MPIPVVCPGCKASFRVSDKFAGKQGPCPRCKTTINIPAATAEEIKIHVPEEHASGGKDSKGRPSTKPIARQETKFNPVTVFAVVVGSLAVVVLAVLLRFMPAVPVVVPAVGLVLISPAIAVGCYALLRNAELEPYRGWSLWIRGAICGLVYTVTWAAFAWLLPIYVERPELWVWMFIVPPFFLAGATAAFATFDFDFGTAAVHYGFYALLTIVLGYCAALFPPTWVTG